MLKMLGLLNTVVRNTYDFLKYMVIGLGWGAINVVIIVNYGKYLVTDLIPHTYELYQTKGIGEVTAETEIHIVLSILGTLFAAWVIKNIVSSAILVFMTLTGKMFNAEEKLRQLEEEERLIEKY